MADRGAYIKRLEGSIEINRSHIRWLRRNRVSTREGDGPYVDHTDSLRLRLLRVLGIKRAILRRLRKDDDVA